MNKTFKTPIIVDNENTLTLKFSENCIQSRMIKEMPNELALGYTQAMMAFLLVEPNPKSILIIGLGGGSLSKYCYENLPESNITTVEISKKVISMRDTFLIPKDNQRFVIINDNAAKYLKGAKNIADVILVDGYNELGIPPELSTASFYQDCYRALKHGGIMASNLSGGILLTKIIESRINSAFSRRIFRIKSPTGYNEIIYGLKLEKLPENTLMRSRASTLHVETGINFTRFLDQIVASTHHWRYLKKPLSTTQNTPE